MGHSSDKGKAQDQFQTEDDLGRMIRWGLEDSFSKAEPPDDVWPKIMSQVQEMRVPARRVQVRRRRSFSLAPLVQTAVVSALLLAFGLGIDRNVMAPRGGQAARSTPTVQKVVSGQELPNDMLSGSLLARMGQQPATHQRQGGAHP
jgi:hypothetical protein